MQLQSSTAQSLTAAPTISISTAPAGSATSAAAQAVSAAPFARSAGPAAQARQAGSKPGQGDPSKDVNLVENKLNIPVKLRNYSSEVVPHPTLLVDPRLTGQSFIAVIIVGQPVGIIHDIELFLEMLKHQSEIWYMLFNDWHEAFGYYKAQFSNGMVRITPLLNTSLPSFLPPAPLSPLPGSQEDPVYIPSTAPTPTPVRTRPRDRPKDAIVIGLGQQVPDYGNRRPVISVSSSDSSSDESSGEERDGDRNENSEGKGKKKAVVFITKKHNPRLQYIPEYHKTSALPRPGAPRPQGPIPMAPSPFSSTPLTSSLSAPYPFTGILPTSFPAAGSKKRQDRSVDASFSNATIGQDPSAKKRRQEIIEAALSSPSPIASTSVEASEPSTNGPRSSSAPATLLAQSATPAQGSPYDYESETDWLGLPEFSNAELDQVADLCAESAATTTSSAHVTRRKKTPARK